ncbi:MAG: hypothetical protein IJO14_07895 [Clostridia bacterium]|nr:hypothetical protein [Clostridia bacterium]
MHYAKQKNVGKKTCRVKPLYGIDRSSFAPPGSLQDCSNLTSDGLPYWKVRPERGRWRLSDGTTDAEKSGFFPLGKYIRGACSLAEGLCWATDTELYIGGRPVENVVLTPSDRKQLIPVGKDLFIAPDGLYLHRESGSWQVLSVGRRFASGENRVYCGPCTEEGRPIWFSAASSAAPEEPEEGEYWVDTSGMQSVVKRYFAATGWEVYEPDRLYLTAANIGAGFQTGDLVTIHAEPFVQNVSTVLLHAERSYVVFSGTFEYPIGVPSSETVIERKCPVMDFAVECNNRIWACRYGDDGNGNFVNEIFCSAPGDPMTWHRFGTGEADCYRASLGCPGAFTGAAVLFDDILFFKENHMVSVSGLFPANFRVSEQQVHGVRAGCERSIAKLGTAIVYCGVDGVYRTNGNVCTRLCDGFPVEALNNAAGGVLGEKYYLAADWADGKRRIAVFDIGSDTWFSEDDRFKTQFFITQRNALYMLCLPQSVTLAGVQILWYCICVSDVNAPGKSTNCLLADGTDESDYMYEPLRDCAWYALTNPLDDDSAECKRIRNVYIRFCLEAGANLSVQVLTDNGQKREVGKFVGYGQRRRMMRVNVLPCTSLQFLLSGSGMCTIQEIGFEYEQVKGEDAYDQ